MSSNKGFTLIELLVVLIIIGVTVSFALLSFGDFGADRRISMATEQFANSLRLAQQQAILENSTLGVEIKNNHYRVLKYSASSQWHPIEKKQLFRRHYFPKNTMLHLDVSAKRKKNASTIIIHPSGDLTPFTLKVLNRKKETVKTVIGRHDGFFYIKKTSTS